MLFVNKLKVLTLMTCLVLVGQGFAEGEKCAANTTWGGFKTVIATKVGEYYEIDTPEKLAWFSCEITKNGAGSQKTNAKLTKSIDLEGKLFIPISAGKGTPSYGGIFDGQGFTIKNLFIDASEIVKTTYGGDAKYAQNIGLFAALKGGTIQNLSLDNVAIYAASSAGDAGTNGADNPISVGAVAGYLEAGTIKNCTVSGKIETSGATNRVGGIAGNVWAATISNCISEADVIATGNNTHVGGILGAVRKDGDVTINSCVYAGETLFSNNGSVGAVVGNYEKNKNITTNDLYYTANYPAVGTGLGNRSFNSTQVENLNTEDVICELNGGTWNTNEGTCSKPTSATWSEGQNNLSMNGSDGFKVTFDANNGIFPEGAKTSKFFAKGTSITADEIDNPTYTGYKFAGWSLTQGGDVQNLGKADKAKTVYAVWKPIHTITFKTAPGTFVGGTNEASKLVAEGDVVTVEDLPELPVKFCAQGSVSDCAYFYGWSTQSHTPYEDYDDVPAEAIVDLPTFTFSSNVTLHAIWVKAETYTVTFNANGRGQTEVAFVKVAKDEKTVPPPDPIAYNGYEFSGRWCEEIPCDNETKFDFNTEIKRNYVLYADWDVPKYNITYMINGKPNTTTGNPATYNVEDATITLKKPENAGETFKGWYDENGNEATTILSGSTGNKTFYASWKYTITYLADNTLSATTTSDEKEHGVAKTLKGATFAHGGCTQDGWSKVSYGKDGYNLDFAVNGSYQEDKDVILFPHWNCGTYNITYEVYGMSVTNRNPGNYTGPAKMTLENAFDPAKKYFFMDNWYKEPTFKTVIRDIQNIDADLTVYARWYNKITYKPGSKVSEAKDSVYKKFFNTAHTFKSSISTYVRANYTLDGWSTTDGGDKVYELGGKYNTNENLTLYPHWAANTHTITYNNVDPSELPEGYPTTYTHENAVTLPVPTRNGYEFLGWYVDDEFNGDAKIEIPEGESEDKEFFAKWSDAVEYTATYNLNGGSMDGEKSFTFTIESNDIDLATPTKNGYTFVGWLDGVTSDVVTVLPTGSFGDRTLTAQWSDPIEYTITYVGADDLENPNPTSYTVLEDDLALLPVAKSGSKFLGWFDENDELVESISAGSTGDITLTAKWAEFPVLVSTYGGIQIFENENKTKTAVIDGTSEETVIIPTADNVSVDQVVFNRDFSGGVKSTVMFPFTVSLNDVGGGDFWEFLAMEYSSETGWLFRIKEPDDNELKANKPYIFIADQESKNIEFNLSSSVSLSTDAMNPSVHNGWAFKGVYEKVSFNEVHPEWKYAYGYSGEQKRNVTKGSFIRLKSTGFEKIDLAPMRAYLVYDKSLAKSARISDNANIGSLPEFIDVEIVGKKGLAIGGGVLNTTTGELKMDRWYDLRGRKLNGKPTTQGTYYYNGKRIIVR